MITKKTIVERDNLDLKQNRYLKSTFVIDSDSKIVKEEAALLTEECNSQQEKAIELFYFVMR